MAKTRHAFQTLVIVAVLLALAVTPVRALEPERISGRLASAIAFGERVRPRTGQQSMQAMPDTFALVAENADFQLFADATTLAFKVVDKRSGYVWSSNLDEVGPDDKLNRTWTAFARSGISIDYLDAKAISRRASITNAEHTLELKPVDGGFDAAVTFTVPSIMIPIQVRLEESGVSVEVPFESIQEASVDSRLGLLHIYPFLGATKEANIPGYMFIPDGCGSLIRFAASTKATNMFYGRFYGADLGMLATLPWDSTIVRPYNVSLPVFGMVHGERENAFVSIVEKGASYGEIQAHPAGVTTRFNFIYPAFVYNESYFQATNRAGAGVTVLQRNTNAFDIKIHYRFLTGDDGDYVGMARSYQQYLADKGVLKRIAATGSDIGIRLEFLAGEKERVLLWQRSIPMTTVAQMASILQDLDVKNPEVIYYGWQPLGATSMPPATLKLERSLGTVEQLSSLTKDIAAAGGRFYLYLDPLAALWGEGGYVPSRDLAMSITNVSLEGYNRFANYYFNLNALRKRYSSLSRDVFSKLEAGLALDSIGSMLYSDFKSGNFLNREGAIEAYQTLLAETGGSTAFYLPNDYLFGFMDAYLDIPLGDSGYIYTTEAVPFVQTVLAGYVPYYGPALNFSSKLRDDLLRLADYGVYPSYFLTHEATARILNTASSWIYSSSYVQWGKEVEQTYQWLNGLLGPVKGQTIVARRVLAPGVVATTYSNGKQIVVNYNTSPFSTAGIVVNGKDAVLREALR